MLREPGGMRESVKTKGRYIGFTICFWIIAIPLLHRAFAGGYIALGGDDAITQIYPTMLYAAKKIREFFYAFFSEKSYVFPMFEWTLGMGENTISTLNWHGFGDPFYLLAAFFSEEKMPYFYSFLFYFRVYLGGIASILFFSELETGKERSEWAYIIGALVYSLTGFTLQCNIHLIFVHAMMYVPLLLLGAERSRKGKRKGILLFSTFGFAMSGFFFLYIGSVAMGVYVIYALIVNRTAWKRAIGQIRSMLAEYMLGLGLSAVIRIPSIIGFLNSDRTGIKEGISIFMSLQQIKSFFTQLFMPQFAGGQQVGPCVR